MAEFSEQPFGASKLGGVAKTVATEAARTAVSIGKTILKESVAGSFPELKPDEKKEQDERVNPLTGEPLSMIDRGLKDAIPFSEVLRAKAGQVAHRKSMPPVGAQYRADLGKVRSQLTTLAKS